MPRHFNEWEIEKSQRGGGVEKSVLRNVKLLKQGKLASTPNVPFHENYKIKSPLYRTSIRFTIIFCWLRQPLDEEKTFFSFFALALFPVRDGEQFCVRYALKT